MAQYGRFEVGDLVHLKSGSPRMVVERAVTYPAQYDFGVETVPATRVYDVAWIVYGTGEVKRDSFKHAMLVLSNDGRRGY